MKLPEIEIVNHDSKADKTWIFDEAYIDSLREYMLSNGFVEQQWKKVNFSNRIQEYCGLWIYDTKIPNKSIRVSFNAEKMANSNYFKVAKPFCINFPAAYFSLHKLINYDLDDLKKLYPYVFSKNLAVQNLFSEHRWVLQPYHLKWIIASRLAHEDFHNKLIKAFEVKNIGTKSDEFISLPYSDANGISYARINGYLAGAQVGTAIDDNYIKVDKPVDLSDRTTIGIDKNIIETFVKDYLDKHHDK